MFFNGLKIAGTRITPAPPIDGSARRTAIALSGASRGFLVTTPAYVGPITEITSLLITDQQRRNSTGQRHRAVTSRVLTGRRIAMSAAKCLVWHSCSHPRQHGAEAASQSLTGAREAQARFRTLRAQADLEACYDAITLEPRDPALLVGSGMLWNVAQRPGGRIRIIAAPLRSHRYAGLAAKSARPRRSWPSAPARRRGFSQALFECRSETQFALMASSPDRRAGLRRGWCRARSFERRGYRDQ